MIRSWKGRTPRIHETAFVSEAAYVVGEVEIGARSSVWPCVVIRGDDGLISVGSDTHVQDGSIVHSYGPSRLGDHVNVGHSAVLHSARVGDHSMIGNNATLLEDVEIGAWCLVGANAMVRMGAKIPAGSFVVGVPAEVRPLSDAQRRMLESGTEGFAEWARQYKEDGLG